MLQGHLFMDLNLVKEKVFVLEELLMELMNLKYLIELKDYIRNQCK